MYVHLFLAEYHVLFVFAVFIFKSILIAESVQQVTYNIDGFALPFADQIRDLGVHHDCRLKYDKHICLIVHNAYKRAVLISKCFHTRNREILKLAFCTYVRPLLEFACQVWSPKYRYLMDKIESVQRFFYKKTTWS